MGGNIGGLLVLACCFLTVNGQCGNDSLLEFYEDDCTRYHFCGLGYPLLVKCLSNNVFSSIMQKCVLPGSVYDDCTGTMTTTTPGGPGTVVVYGPVSLVQDEARSVAICPVGSVPINCVCSNVGTGCDGSLIVGRRCTAFNSLTGSGERAYAVCYYDEIDNWKVVNSRFAQRPVARCPPGYELVQCTIWNRYNHQGLIRAVLNKTSRTCTAERRCVSGRGCNVQAVCKKM